MKRNKKAKFARNILDTRPRILCPYCGTSIVSDQMDSHVRVIHFKSGYHIAESKHHPSPQTIINAKISDAVPPSTPSPQLAEVHCPKCGISVSHLVDHLLEAHSNTSNIQKNSQPTRPSARPGQRPQPAPPSARPEQRPQPAPRATRANTPAAPRRTGVFYDDELFSVEVEGKCIGTAGSAKEGWEMIEEYRRR